MQAEFPITALDIILQKTAFSFDASVWEFYLPLMNGARVLMALPGGHQDSAYLVRTVAEQKVTILQLVPSMLQVLLGEPGIENCRSLKRVFCGGEAVPHKLQERFFTLLDAELINLYGPTEVSIDATFWKCVPNYERDIVPIGHPVSNAQVYLLDKYLQPVALGVPGELHVGGVGLARGYHHRTELTAEKFIPDPFSAEPGSRLYRTGDRARHLGDGAIEFLGRIDQQVKIRGFRIEMGEVEAALSQHPGVREVTVMIREDEPGHSRLVAYVVPRDRGAVSGQPWDQLVSGLRSWVQERLPEPMQPSVWMGLAELPAEEQEAALLRLSGDDFEVMDQVQTLLKERPPGPPLGDRADQGYIEERAAGHEVLLRRLQLGEIAGGDQEPDHGRQVHRQGAIRIARTVQRPSRWPQRSVFAWRGAV